MKYIIYNIQYEEIETGKFIVEKLKALGNIEIIEKVGRTGVVGILRGKLDGPCILLRAGRKLDLIL